MSQEARVLVSGSTGFIGAALVRHLEDAGVTVHRLVRGDPGPGDAAWGEPGGPIDASRVPGGSLEGLDAVVHLAGAPIATHRWSDSRRRELVESRVDTTAKLAMALASCEQKPRVLASGSAIGWYGDRGDEVLDETSAPGKGFLADLCRRWEEAPAPASEAGIRVVQLRSGIVLGPGGGTLEPLVRLFKAGAGGPVGSGRQWVSWISLEDELAAVSKLLADDGLAGPVNLVAPAPVTNAELVKELAKALRRPHFARVPAAGLRLVLGRQLADELLLASQRAMPAKLAASGFEFSHPNLASAVAAALGLREDQASTAAG
jgi:uncharacterized protein (TIGR01777 family)